MSTKRSSNSTNVGNAGEHLIMAELLARGYHAFMADRGNPSFDLAAILPDQRQVKIRCKTCGTNRTLQYDARKSGEIFLELDPASETDFVALIAPRKGEVFTSRTAEIWILPTVVMDKHLWQMNEEYLTILEHQLPRTTLKFTLQSSGISSTKFNSPPLPRQTDLSHGIQEVGGSIPPGSTILHTIFNILFNALEGVSRGSKRSVTL